MAPWWAGARAPGTEKRHHAPNANEHGQSGIVREKATPDRPERIPGGPQRLERAGEHDQRRARHREGSIWRLPGIYRGKSQTLGAPEWSSALSSNAIEYTHARSRMQVFREYCSATKHNASWPTVRGASEALRHWT